MVAQPSTLSEEDAKKAVQAFEALGICNQLAEAAASLGWKSPSSIQEQAIPQVLQGERRGGGRAGRAVGLQGTCCSQPLPASRQPGGASSAAPAGPSACVLALQARM